MNFLSKLLQGISMLPAIIVGIENLFGAKGGAQKQSAAIQFIGTTIDFTEAISQKDIVDQKAFQEGLKQANDGVVKMLNASIWYGKKQEAQ